MDYNQFLTAEYKRRKKEIVYCQIGNEKVIVPCAYEGDKKEFLKDLFAFQAQYANNFEKFNKNNPEREIKRPATIVAGDAQIETPLELAKNSYKPEYVVKEMTARAIRELRRAVRITANTDKRFPDEAFEVFLDAKYLSKLRAKNRKHDVKKAADAVYSASKWMVEHGINAGTGVVGSPFALGYHFLNKKYKFAKNNFTNGIEKKAIPYIKKGLLKAAILGSVALGAKITYDNITQDDTQDKIEIVDDANLNAVQKHNQKVFYENLDKIKLMTAFFENYLPRYHCGKKHTLAYGTTFYVDKNGNGKNGENPVKVNDKQPSKEEGMEYMENYYTHLTFEKVILKAKVELDDETMVGLATIGYVAGPGVGNSNLMDAINEGKKGEDLALPIAIYAKDEGIPKRNIYALMYMMGELSVSEILDFTAEGCYNHEDLKSIFKHDKKGKRIRKKCGDFNPAVFKLDKESIEKAKEIAREPRISNVTGKPCQKVRDIIPKDLLEKLLEAEKNNDKNVISHLWNYMSGNQKS